MDTKTIGIMQSQFDILAQVVPDKKIEFWFWSVVTMFNSIFSGIKN